MEISTQMVKAVVQRYLDEGVVCPLIMCKGICTTYAVDKIDHNPSVTTAMSFFQGTGISLFQHPSDDSRGEDRAPLLLGDRPINSSRVVYKCETCILESKTRTASAGNANNAC